MTRPGRVLLAVALAVSAAAEPAARPAATPRVTPAPQPRPHGTRVAVPVDRIHVDDGDTLSIDWPDGDRETVRVLGIDAPETAHVAQDIPYAQPFGAEARAFARGVFAASPSVEILRGAGLDPYGRTLGYLFCAGRNYSVLIIGARLAEETVSRYGDDGFPTEAAEVTAAARSAGPLPFESPSAFRTRMRTLSAWRKSHRLPADAD